MISFDNAMFVESRTTTKTAKRPLGKVACMVLLVLGICLIKLGQVVSMHNAQVELVSAGTESVL